MPISSECANHRGNHSTAMNFASVRLCYITVFVQVGTYRYHADSSGRTVLSRWSVNGQYSRWETIQGMVNMFACFTAIVYAR